MVRKGLQVQNWPYLDHPWPCNFFHWVKKKVKKVCEVRFVGAFFKNLCY